MQLPDEIAQLGAGGWLGWLVAAVTGGAFAIRRIWHADLVSGANSKAAVDTIQRLYDLLDRERENNGRLEKALVDANQERIKVVRELGEMRAELEALRTEVRMLREGKQNAI